MIAEKIHKKVTVSDFKAHCTEYIRELENTDQIIEITRHGKIVAIAKKPEPDKTTQKGPQSIAELMGSLRDTVIFSKDYDPDEPTFSPEEWEEHPVNQEA